MACPYCQEDARMRQNWCRWDVLRLKPKRCSGDAITVRWQRQLYRGKNLREIVPGVGEAWSLRDARVSGRLAQSVEPIAQVAHQAMAVAHDLRASESLEAAHAPRPVLVN